MSGAAEHFDFEADERWTSYLQNVEFAGQPTEAQLIKLKNKWYKKTIDADFEIPTAPSRAEPAPTVNPIQEDEPPRSRSQQNTDTAAPPPAFESTGSVYGDAQKSAQEMVTMIRRVVSAIQPGRLRVLLMASPLQTLWIFLHMAFVFLTLWFYIPYFGWSTIAYHRPLKASMLLYAISMYSALGMPQWNQDYARRVLDNSNTHFLLYSIVFIIDNETRMGGALWPLFIYSSFNLFDYMKTRFVPVVAPSMTNELKNSNVVRQFEQFRRPASMIAADMEVKLFLLTVVFAILSLFGIGTQTISTSFFYFQLLRLRYRVNPDTQRAVAVFKHTVDGYLYSPRCPVMITNVYKRMTAWMGYN
eukprot:CFRG5368T1